VQWELAAPLKAGALSVGIHPVLQQQSHSPCIALPHCLVQSMIPGAAVPSL